MSAITRKEVEHVANLARLQLTEEEAERYTKDLNAILDFAAKLGELDTSSIQPTSHATDVKKRHARGRQSTVPAARGSAEKCAGSRRRAVQGTRCFRIKNARPKRREEPTVSLFDKRLSELHSALRAKELSVTDLVQAHRKHQGTRPRDQIGTAGR